MIHSDWDSLLDSARLRRPVKRIEPNAWPWSSVASGLVEMKQGGVLVDVWCDTDRLYIATEHGIRQRITWLQAEQLVEAFRLGRIKIVA